MIEQGCVNGGIEEVIEMRQEIASNTTGLAQTGGGRIFYLDALKCFAILLVIEGHVRTLGMHIKTDDILSGLMFYTFDLPIFFFVSGYLAYKPTMCITEAWKNIQRKIVLLLVPALVISTAYQLLNHGNILSPLKHGFGIYWFTIVLFECFLIYYVVLVVVKKDNLRVMILIILSLLGLSLLAKFSVFGPRILDFNHLCKYFWFFVVGLIFKKYNDRYIKIMKSELFKGVAIASFFMILFTLDYQIYPRPVMYFLRDICLRLLGTGIVVVVFYNNSNSIKKDGKIYKIITEIGQRSLPIYLLQYFFIPDFTSFPEWVSGLDTFTIHLMGFVYTVFITATCLCFIKVLELSSFMRKYVLGQKA